MKILLIAIGLSLVACSDWGTYVITGKGIPIADICSFRASKQGGSYEIYFYDSCHCYHILDTLK